MRRLRRLVQRALVFALGAAAVWLIAFVIFPAADKRLPLSLAVAVTYALAAYVVLPRVVHFSLRVLKRGRVPAYTVTGDGLPGDPVNIALIGSLAELKAAFAQAGWYEADRLGLLSSLRMAQSFVLNRPYPTAPFSTLFLFGRGQDVGFQCPIGGSPRKRHHVRFWGVPLERAEATAGEPAFWLGSDRPADGERALWVGAATRDTGLSLTRLTFQITHAVDSDTNEEREFLVGVLARAGRITNIRSYEPGERVAHGKVNHYVTDGFVAVADLAGA